MTNIKRILQMTVLTLGLSGCTHSVHQYHVSSIKPSSRKSQSKKIQAEAEQFVILGMTKETNYVNNAFLDLQKKCLNGRVTGIHTRFSTSHSFFSWTNKIKMTGSCIR